MDLLGKGTWNRLCEWTGAGGDETRRDQVGREWSERVLGQATGMGGH